MILITGHKGYIGSHLYKALKSFDMEVYGIDLKDGHDIAYCLPDRDFDYVFHLAALPQVEYCNKHPSYALKQNVGATSILLEWAYGHNVKKVIFSSSAAVYGDGGGPKSPYGLHKLMAEMECKLYSDFYNIDTVCLRYFNVYSEDQPYGGSYSTVIAAWMEMMRNGHPLRLDGTGKQTRDFVHVEDIVAANIFCMKSKLKFNGECYDVGSGQSTALNTIKYYIDHRYSNVSWLWTPEREGDIFNSVADISKLAEIGWTPQIDIKTGLSRCF
tara:strand:+ start:48640 stop:49452 length:813 start_codon:yes stop_codon:yes gene_type:complete